MIIKLKGITKHGKNRIHEHGNEWRVIEPMVTPKPAQLFIESVKTGDRRWLNHNFEVIPVDSV
jgi:hypothetical protein